MFGSPNTALGLLGLEQITNSPYFACLECYLSFLLLPAILPAGLAAWSRLGSSASSEGTAVFPEQYSTFSVPHSDSARFKITCNIC